MKSEEFMIGDWVTILRFRENGSDRNVRINGIGRDCILAPGMFQDDTGCDPYDYEHLAPIPLTPEILEKNGFRYELDYGQFYRSVLGDCAREKEPYVCIRWNSQGRACCWEVSNKPSFMEGAVAFGYNHIAVHELQHALRLCGLNELADNFII